VWGPLGPRKDSMDVYEWKVHESNILSSYHILDGSNGHLCKYQVCDERLEASNFDNLGGADIDLRMWLAYLDLWEVKGYNTFKFSTRFQFDGKDIRLERGNDA